jgi:hypothetical protein
MRRVFIAMLVLVASAATAQQRPIFDPDDFVDPRVRGGAFFVSRLVAGGAADFVDDYRPVDHSATFVHLANSLYWRRFEFDYKHSEVRAGGPLQRQVCPCNPPVYFPTEQVGAPPPAPPQGSKETLQFGWYHTSGGGEGELPVMLRYRLTYSRQDIDTDLTFLNTDHPAGRLSGHEQTFGLEAETHFRIASRDVWGSLHYAHTASSGTTHDRVQNEIAYMSRFRGMAFRRLPQLLLRATLTVGGVSGRGGTGLNLVNPAFEALWYDHKTRANIHLVWSPQSMRSGVGGWNTQHQIALFVDRALYVKVFGRRGAGGAD